MGASTSTTIVHSTVSILSAVAIAIVVYLATTYLATWSAQAARLLFKTIISRPSTAGKASASTSLKPTTPEISKAPDFPSDWWTSPTQYALETRAILSKTWLHLAHTSTLPRPGSYKTVTIGPHSLLLIRGKDYQLRAFHNICRHRAYTVVTRAQGCSQALMCRYHGWTYDSTGELVRAPKFEEVGGFEKRANGLWEVRSFVDSSGFVYVNLDVYGSDGLTIRVGEPMRAKLRLLESWTEDAAFNWKIAVPQGSFQIPSMAAKSSKSSLRRLLSGDFVPWRGAAEFELSPLTNLIRSPQGELWLTLSIVPKTHDTSTIVCALYTTALASSETTQVPMSAFKSEVQGSIAALAETYERIKYDGETAADFAQEPLLAECRAHTRLERFMCREIYPASRMRESSQECKVADELCQELEAEAAADAANGRGRTNGVFAW